MFQSPLITVEELIQQIDNPKLILLDCSIDKVNESLNNKEVNLIPNSLFFDIENDFSDHQNPLPHTLVSESVFTTQAQLLGINNNSIIVLYDRWGVYSSPRAWWMFKVMSHTQVYILNGGIIAWQTGGHATVKQHTNPTKKGNFTAVFDKNLYATLDDVLDNHQDPETAIIDARGAKRFNGEAPEPRAGLRSGHIPHSKNIPFDEVLNSERYKSENEIKAIFHPAMGDSKQQIFTCGSGITASILAFASYISGNRNFKVYDGSWSEWGKENLNLPISKENDAF